MTKIYLIRHGKTINNFRNIWGGDSLLTEEGIDDAISIKNKDLKIDYLYVSEKIRTQQTADYAFPEKEYIVDKRFNEIDFGILEETHYENDDALDKDKARQAFYNNIKGFHCITKGENVTDRALKFVLAIHEIANKYDGKTIAIISHETIILSALAFLYKGDVNYKSNLKMRTGEVLELEVDGDAIILKGDLLTRINNVVLDESE